MSIGESRLWLFHAKLCIVSTSWRKPVGLWLMRHISQRDTVFCVGKTYMHQNFRNHKGGLLLSSESNVVFLDAISKKCAIWENWHLERFYEEIFQCIFCAQNSSIGKIILILFISTANFYKPTDLLFRTIWCSQFMWARQIFCIY